MNVFLDEGDYKCYIRLLKTYATNYGLTIAAYCLMPNHIHLVGLPKRGDCIGKALQYCHGKYGEKFNEKYEKYGHVWQARPWSCPMDDSYAWAAVRYVERNPVRAKLVARAEDYRWSSAPAHCGGETDPLLTSQWPTVATIEDWSTWLGGGPDAEDERLIRELTYTGRPCGSDDFVRSAEAAVGRRLRQQKPGPKLGPSVQETNPLLWDDDEESAKPE